MTTAKQTFIPGLQLSQLFYEEAVQPVLLRHWPGLRYSAGLLGPGSDVQGFDTEQSMDHDWGPRLLLFLPANAYTAYSEQIDATLRTELPVEVRGFSTNYAGQADGTRWMQPVLTGPVNHGVRIVSFRDYFVKALNCDPTHEIRLIDWLTLPNQILREVTSGRVFHDDLGLGQIREKLRYYPHSVWLYMVAAQWSRIGEEEAFVGRCAQLGDETGSRMVAARLVRDLMGLSFLLAKQYIPYLKWLGTAFSRLEIAANLQPVLLNVLSATGWLEREQHLCAAYELLAQAHNALRISEPGPTQVVNFHDRPFRVIQGGHFAELTRAAITDPDVLALPANVGAIDQYVDSTQVLSRPKNYDHLKSIYVR